MRLRLIILLFFSAIATAHAQEADLTIGSRVYHMIDRLDILGISDTIIRTDVRPVNRQYLSAIFEQTDITALSSREQAWFEQSRIFADDNYAAGLEGRGILKYFYRNSRDFLHHTGENFTIFVNPVLYLSAGTESQNTPDSSLNEFLYRNTRGLQIRGSLLKKVGYFAEVTENQWETPYHVYENYLTHGVLNGAGFIKTFDDDRFDYFNARGYLIYQPVTPFQIKFGRDRSFWGNGFQSLYLSDFATDHLMLELRTRIWKFEYVNHFGRFTDFIRNKPDPVGTHPAKYGAFHMLNFSPFKNFSAGIFEAVMYSPILPYDTRGFELEYLNPLIFYRSVEQSLGSPDNSFIGFQAKYNFLKKFRFYGQILIDDFNFRNRKNGSGYWGNKYGYQVGINYINVFGIPTLDLQVEYNRLRPFTYTHFNTSANYSHYGQFLGHSAGTNLFELAAQLKFHPWRQWEFTGDVIYQVRGENMDGLNYGGDIFVPYSNRAREYGNYVGQGAERKVTILHGAIDYQIMNLPAFITAEATLRHDNDITSGIITGGLRYQIPNRINRY